MALEEPTAETNPALAVWESVLAYAPRFLKHLRSFDRQPGYQVAVAVDGVVIGTVAGGYADVGSGTGLTAAPQFRLAFEDVHRHRHPPAGRTGLADP
ncbi:MAG: beta-lactamase family protein [Micrococcaceae bacterium]|nr:beta-lactamase family protein [Micrococcaceae bacterium]